jgi:hypothetical protein
MLLIYYNSYFETNVTVEVSGNAGVAIPPINHARPQNAKIPRIDSEKIRFISLEKIPLSGDKVW